VLALFAFGFLAALFALGFVALVVASFVALVVASLVALVLAGFAFNFLAAIGGVGLVAAVVLFLSGNSLFGGVDSAVVGTIVTAASGHRESKCHSGKNGEKNFLHFFDVFY
jgi:hypothetical protein